MAAGIIRILVQSELSILPVTCTQMIAYTEFVSRQCNINSYTKFEENRSNNTQDIERKRSADGRTDGHSNANF